MLEETIKYFLEFIFNPNVDNGKFDTNSFNKAKNPRCKNLGFFFCMYSCYNANLSFKS